MRRVQTKNVVCAHSTTVCYVGGINTTSFVQGRHLPKMALATLQFDVKDRIASGLYRYAYARHTHLGT